MLENKSLESRLTNLLENYGNGLDGTSPSAKQWEALLRFPKDKPVALINYFELRQTADYPDNHSKTGVRSGPEAFNKYAALAAPLVEKAGGRFLYMGSVVGGFIGNDTNWTLAVVGAYPSPESALSLFEDPGYMEIYAHRKAACKRQYILVTTELPMTV